MSIRPKVPKSKHIDGNYDNVFIHHIMKTFCDNPLSPLIGIFQVSNEDISSKIAPNCIATYSQQSCRTYKIVEMQCDEWVMDIVGFLSITSLPAVRLRTGSGQLVYKGSQAFYCSRKNLIECMCFKVIWMSRTTFPCGGEYVTCRVMSIFH